LEDDGKGTIVLFHLKRWGDALWGTSTQSTRVLPTIMFTPVRAGDIGAIKPGLVEALCVLSP